MGAANHYLVSFEDVSATIGSFNVSSIVELHLNATANDIPQITLLVDAGNPNGTSRKAADPVSIGRARDIIDKLRSIVKKNDATLSLSVTVHSVGSAGEYSQTLNINGWLLTDVALSPIQEGGVCTVSLTCMHPLCKAHFGGAMPGLISVAPDLKKLSGGNPLAVFLKALELYGSAARIQQPRKGVTVAGSASSEEIRKTLLEQLNKARESLSTHLSWSGGGLPAGGPLATSSSLLRNALSDYAMPSGGTSVFQRFVKCMVPECSLAVGGDYTSDALSVGPFRPWAADNTFTVRESDIISMSFPQDDPSPLSGVHMIANDTSDGLSCSYHQDSCQTDDRPSDIFYVPRQELSKDYLYGPVYQLYEPGWLSSLWAYTKNSMSRKNSEINAAKSGNLYTGNNVGRDDNVTFGAAGQSMPPVNYSKAMMACAKAYYETTLMKDWSFSVTTRMLFTSDGTVCPGRSMSVVTDGGEVLAGYVTGVTHTISVPNRTAHTTISCTHPRFGEPPNGITGENALYA